MKSRILALFILGLVVGCTTGTEPRAPQEEPAPPSDITSDISIDSEVSEVGTITEDLNAGELDSIEQDLAEVNW
jgi:hypothetical protein